MANEPYKDKSFLYEMYVQRRMNLTDICKHLKDSYNIEVTPQAVYNWVKKALHRLVLKGRSQQLRLMLRSVKENCVREVNCKERGWEDEKKCNGKRYLYICKA